MARDELEQVVDSLLGVIDGEEQVDEFSHALQCANLAVRTFASRIFTAAALLHDVARSPIVARDYPDTPHEQAGAQWLLPRFGPYVAWLAGAHVAAKLYLLETEPGYADVLSTESTNSVLYQQTVSYAEFVEHRWWPDALRLRRFDDAAKDPNAILPDLQDLLRIVRPLRAR